MKLKLIFRWSALGLTLMIIALGIWLWRLNQSVVSRFQGQRFTPPIEFYSAPEVFRPGFTIQTQEVVRFLESQGYRRRSSQQTLQEKDFSVFSREECLPLLFTQAPPDRLESEAPPIEVDLTDCVAFRQISENNSALTEWIGFSEAGIVGTWMGQPPTAVPQIRLAPLLFAQFYGENPVLRRIVPLGSAPMQCLDALLAIEDSQFLEHQGVSLKGIFRAFVANIRAGRAAEGGSTITQQLVKNYFLTPEKTIRRKLKEMVLALILETRFSKEEILETYINLIYMGQNGPFQVRGFAAAADHYFQKPLENLNLAECALLAAIVNSPGLYNPLVHPERSQARREKVLERMVELQMIDKGAAKEAALEPLPNRPMRPLSEPAPYFVQTLRKKIQELGIDDAEGLRVYSTLRTSMQEAAHSAVTEGIKHLESNFSTVKSLKEKGKLLQAALIAADPGTGAVHALVGGRSFRKTQYNRALEAHRQVGSVMKPIVYLSALESSTPEGQPYTPMTMIDDRPLVHKFDGQVWAPENYDGKHRGPIPLYFALKESLNVPTARLALDLGISNVIDVARRLGITSRLTSLPSLSLGAFEMYPVEVLQAYTTLAAFGLRTPLYFIERIEDLNGDVLFEHAAEHEQAFAPGTVATLVGMMKQTLLTGTARSARAWGWTAPAAGKTGTTNDTKDAWFAGFTPHHVAISWVGYDDNTAHKLSGTSAALPIWSTYMRAAGRIFPHSDFEWPEEIVKVEFEPDELDDLLPEGSRDLESNVELVFRKGTEPKEKRRGRGFFNF